MNNSVFEEAGFVKKSPIHFIKEGTVEKQPYLHEHVEDSETVLGSMRTNNEITFDDGQWWIALSIPEANYFEDRLSLDSEDGLGVYKDCLSVN